MSQTKAQLLDPQGDFTLTGQLIGVGATFSGNVSIAGTLTKQDVTNVDSVGVVTARSGVNVTGGNVFIGQGGSGANNAELKLQAGAGTGNDIIAFLNQAGATRGNLTYDTDNNFLLFNVNASERLRIKSDGAVNLTTANASLEWTASSGSNPFIRSIGSGQQSLEFNTGGEERLRITNTGQVAIGTVTGETNYLTTINGDLSLGEKNGTSNTFIDQKQDGDLHLINSGRSAQGGSGSPGVAGVGINRYNNISGDTTKFRDFAVYNGKDTKVLVVDGSAGLVGIATDAPADAFLDIASTAGTEAIRMRRLSSDVNVASNWAFKAYAKNLYFREGSSSPYDRVYFTDTGNVVTVGEFQDAKGELRSIPQNAQTGSSIYEFVAADAGKHILRSGGHVRLPSNTFAAGTAITVVNNSASDINFISGSGVTLYNTADGSTGQRTLAARGTATVLYTTAGANVNAYISGSGLS